MDGMEFNVAGWREIHAMDIQDGGAGLLISGAVLHTGEQRPYFRWACMAVDPITGKTKQLGNLGSNAGTTHSALSHDVCLHPSEPLACLTSIHKYGQHGLFSWNPEALGSAKVTTEIPVMSRATLRANTCCCTISRRIRLSTSSQSPRPLRMDL